MVTIVFVYNRWSKSELHCYVDGVPASHTDMSWLVNTSDVSADDNDGDVDDSDDDVPDGDNEGNEVMATMMLMIKVPLISLSTSAIWAAATTWILRPCSVVRCPRFTCSVRHSRPITWLPLNTWDLDIRYDDRFSSLFKYIAIIIFNFYCFRVNSNLRTRVAFYWARQLKGLVSFHA